MVQNLLRLANLVSLYRLKRDHGIIIDGATDTLRFEGSNVEVAKWKWETPTESLEGCPWLQVATDHLPNGGAFLTSSKSKIPGKEVSIDIQNIGKYNGTLCFGYWHSIFA